MSTVADAAVIAAVILDIISMYRDKGVEVDLESLGEAIEDEKARRDQLKKKLGLK